jgi:hypothetical protein
MTAPLVTVKRNTISLPENLVLPKSVLSEALTIIEKDIHQRVKRGRRLNGQAQTKNAPSTRLFKQKHGLGKTPLVMGWSPKGYHRFTSKFERQFKRGGAVLFLSNRPPPGGKAGCTPREVAGYLNRGVKRRAKSFLQKGGAIGRSTAFSSGRAFVGGGITAVRYHVPFGISDKAGVRVAKRITTRLKRQIAKQARRKRGRSR